MHIKLMTLIGVIIFFNIAYANPLTHITKEALEFAAKNNKLALEEAALAKKAAQESSALSKEAIKNNGNSSLKYMVNIENSPYYTNVIRMVNKCKQTQKRDPKIKDCENNAKAYEQCISHKINNGLQITQSQRKCESQFKI